MKEQFVPYETAKMLKELGMILPLNETFASWGEPENGGGLYTGSFDTTALRAPLWQQVKQWLWEKHQIFIRITQGMGGTRFICVACKSSSGLEQLTEDIGIYNPITAEIEGIKKAVEYLHEKK